jgi:MoaA/NifB/PqqE/SkfB family radical SAM enzyme
VDSYDENLQSYTRRHPFALKSALKSVQRLQQFNIPVTILTVISRYNYSELYRSALVALQKGIREIVYQPVIAFSNYPEQKAIGDKKDLNVPVNDIPILMEQLYRIERLERTYPLNTNVYRIKPWIRQYLQSMATENGSPFYTKISPRFYCREVEAVIDISYDGGIQPCGLQPAQLFLQDHPEKTLIGLWREAIATISSDINEGRFPDSCKGCCHKFSRNMIASALKYPWHNRAILGILVSSMALRSTNRLLRKTKSER